MSTGGEFTTVARQTSFFFGVQVFLLVAQLGYTAVTSRIFDPQVFGAYAVAAATAAFGSLITVAGFTKAAARRQDEDVRADRELLGAAVAISLVVAVLLVLAAPLIARIWADESSITLIRLLSLGLIASAYAGVCSGFLRRLGRIDLVTVQSLVAGLMGIALGVALVATTRQTWSLAVMPVATPVIAAAMAGTRLGQRGLPLRPTATAAHDMRFSMSSSGVSLTSFVAYTIPAIVLSRVAGAATLGSWNRAVALAQVPVEVGTRSWTTVTFPRFRHHQAQSRTSSIWTDLACGGAWLVLPVAAVLTPGVQIMMGLVLGPNWTLAQEMAPWLWIGASLAAVYTLVGTAAESAGHFRILWTSQIPDAIILTIATFTLWLTGDWLALAVGVVAAAAGHLIVIVASAGRQGLLQARVVYRRLALTVGVSLLLAVPLWVASWHLPQLASLFLCAMVAGGFLLITYRSRSRIPGVNNLLRR